MLREPVREGRTRIAAETGATTTRNHDYMGCRPVWREVRYVLSIRTNVVLVVGCSFGYFFMAGHCWARARFSVVKPERSDGVW